MRRSLFPCALALILTTLPLPSQQGAAGPQTAQGGEPSVDAETLLGPPRGRPLAGEELERRTAELAGRMRCPVCQGLSIADSPAASALAMLAQVRDLLAAGYTEKQILDYFVRSYGEFVLLEPKPEGFNLVVWLAPVAILLLGAVFIAVRLRRAPARAEPQQDEGLDEYLQRVRSEAGS